MERNLPCAFAVAEERHHFPELNLRPGGCGLDLHGKSGHDLDDKGRSAHRQDSSIVGAAWSVGAVLGWRGGTSSAGPVGVLPGRAGQKHRFGSAASLDLKLTGARCAWAAASYRRTRLERRDGELRPVEILVSTSCGTTWTVASLLGNTIRARPLLWNFQ